MAKRLSKKEAIKKLSKIPDWKLVKGQKAIRREFKFKDFNDAFAFMTRAATAVEFFDHHPEWSNSYNRVSVVLTTHDVKGLSELDFKSAQKMDKFANKIAKQSE